MDGKYLSCLAFKEGDAIKVCQIAKGGRVVVVRSPWEEQPAFNTTPKAWTTIAIHNSKEAKAAVVRHKETQG